MAKRRRIPKKRLKEPDEFISTAARILSWTVKNLKLLLIGIIICTLVVLSVVFWRIKARNREVEALTVFYQASEMLMSAENPSSEGYQEAVDELKRIQREYPHTDVVGLAQLQLGQGFLNSKQYDKAVQTYRKFLDSDPRERLYRLLALQNLGYAYEGQGDYQGALDSFQSLLAKGESFLQPWGYLNVSRCYEKLGKREEALKTYRAFLEKFPDSTMAPMIRSKISILESR
ncbi:MAG: tol-pal system YbgF family protein [Thermodesulfobacteriota bacterium]